MKGGIAIEASMRMRLKSMPADEAARFAVLVCDAVLKCSKTAYHGGLYPENILYTEDNISFISPGIKKERNSEEIAFMSPEVYWGSAHNELSDVYSIGMLLYYACSGGRLPLGERGEAVAIRSRMEGEGFPPPVGAGRRLGNVILRAMAFKPEDRFTSLTELKAMLKMCIEGFKQGEEAEGMLIFGKPEEKLSEVERMMLSILSERVLAPAPEEPESPAVIIGEEPDTGADEDTVPGPEENPAEQPGNDAETAAAEEKAPAEDKPAAEAETGREKEVIAAGETAGRHEADSGLSPEQKDRAEFYARAIDEGMKQRVREQYDRKLEREKAIKNKLHNSRQNSILLAMVLLIGMLSIALIVNARHGISIFTRDNSSDIYKQINAQPEITPEVQVVGTLTVTTPAPTAVPEETQGQTHTGPVVYASKQPDNFEILVSDVSWEQAAELCRQRGGHLAVITNSAELEIVCSKMAAAGLSNAWIGCRSTNGNGDFVWVNGGRYTMFWDDGEPTGYDNDTNQYEDYVLLWNKNGYWAYNDIGPNPARDYPWMYSGKIGYVCEYDR